MQVHKAAWEAENGSKTPCAYIRTSLVLEPEVHDLVNGLGSHYFRNEVGDDDEREGDRPESLPTDLSQAQIVKIYRDQFQYWGGANLNTWADNVSEKRFLHANEWLTQLVVDAFPEMEEYVR